MANKLSGFTGFTGVGSYTPLAQEQPDQASVGKRVFEQMIEHLQKAKEAQQTQRKSDVDMLWPMGTIMKGKRQ
jgi:hypothetical protein